MTTTITAEGMSCEHCEQTIEEAIRGISGISDARANREAASATIEGDPDSTDPVQAAKMGVAKFRSKYSIFTPLYERNTKTTQYTN